MVHDWTYYNIIHSTYIVKMYTLYRTGTDFNFLSAFTDWAKLPYSQLSTICYIYSYKKVWLPSYRYRLHIIPIERLSFTICIAFNRKHKIYYLFLLLKVLYFVSGRPWIYMSSDISFSPHIRSDTMEPVVKNVAYSSLF